jgi:UDP-GlcNAc:undecaprenyl-phosphate GlcNAc-1-phosphate transferase
MRQSMVTIPPKWSPMREYLVVFLVAAVISYLLCVVARELAGWAGAVAQVRDRDVHAIPIPYFGGVAMLGGLAAGYLVALKLPFLSLAGGYVFHDAAVVVVAGAIICAVGVLDDIYELDALTKLGGQVLAAGFLVLNGVQFYSFNSGSEQMVLDPALSMLGSIFLVVGTVNAVNFVDGLDGLAGGIVGIGAVAFFCFSYALAVVNDETLAISSAVLCAALAGACAGFLPHNFFPARIFMGDSGSMLLGLVLAASALTLTGQFSNVSTNQGLWGQSSNSWILFLPALLPISILMIPFLDLVMAVIRRTRRGEMFYHPDKQHLHHRLLGIGHSQRRAVLIMWSWVALIGFGLVGVSLYPRPITLVAIVAGALFASAGTWLLPRMQRTSLG